MRGSGLRINKVRLSFKKPFAENANGFFIFQQFEKFQKFCKLTQKYVLRFKNNG
jgi:hypothetical protein